MTLAETTAASDESLILATRAGDANAYAELWRRHAGAAMTAARYFTQIAEPDDLVLEAYTRILAAIRAGRGPEGTFRPYLYTTVRNLARALSRRGLEEVGAWDFDLFEAEDQLGHVGDGPEESVTVRAFRSLPERWQSALWYTEIEGFAAKEIGELLGVSANSAAALTYRAREGLKTAWLQEQVDDRRSSPECKWTLGRLGKHVRNALGPAESERVTTHLNSCARCAVAASELGQLGSKLRIVVAPVLIGGIGVGAFIASLQQGGAASAAALAGGAGAATAGAAAGGAGAAHGTAGTGIAHGAGAAGAGAGVAAGGAGTAALNGVGAGHGAGSVAVGAAAVGAAGTGAAGSGAAGGGATGSAGASGGAGGAGGTGIMVGAIVAAVGGLLVVGVVAGGLVLASAHGPLKHSTAAPSRAVVAAAPAPSAPSASAAPSPSATPTPVAAPIPTPSATPHPSKAASPSPSPSPTPTAPPAVTITSSIANSSTARPTLTGTAEPGATVTVTADGSAVVSTVTAGPNGAFSTGELGSLSTAVTSLSVVQQVGSLRSPAVTVQTDFAPAFASPANGVSCRVLARVSVVLSGWPGEGVVLNISGGSHYTGTLDASGAASFNVLCVVVGTYTLTGSYATGGGTSSITGSVVR